MFPTSRTPTKRAQQVARNDTRWPTQTQTKEKAPRLHPQKTCSQNFDPYFLQTFIQNLAIVGYLGLAMFFYQTARETPRTEENHFNYIT